MRIMGLDVGDKRIGVAVSDESRRVALPLVVVTHKDLESDLKEIGELAEKHAVSEIVVGIPLSLSGKMGPQAQKVLNFFEALGKRQKIPVKLWDERLSTVSVEKILVAGEVRRKKRKKLVDKLAAAVILQSYLDSYFVLKENK